VDGVVEQVRFHREETLYTVMRIRHESSPEQDFTVIAHLPMPKVGERYRFTGAWETHPVYGRQFRAVSWEIPPPVTIDGIRAYLASEVDEIGPGLAGRIVEAFGLKTLEVIDTTPELLRGVPGIGAKRARAVIHAWQARRGTHDALVFLYSQGMSVGLASRIVRQYGEETAHVVRTDPYRLALEVQGVGFMTADAIAMKNGIARDSAERASAGVLFTLGSAASRGHTYLPRRLLVQETARLLGVKDVTAASRIDALHSSGLLHVEQSPSGGPDRDPVFLPGLAEAESESARMLAAIARSPGRTSGLDPQRAVEWMEAAQRITLSYRQKEAVRRCASSTCMVLTGGPGTGKTSTITAIIHLFDRAGARIALCAPTGRAARRMSEATGYDASTIHRLLEFNPGTREFTKNERSPLEADLIIVDEFSMVDVALLYRLLCAVTPGTTLVFVGDVDQLPSVGPGDCLKEIIASGVADVVRLETIFRQDDSSSIVLNCHRINRGMMPEASRDLSGDYLFFPEEDPSRILDKVISLVTSWLPGRYGLDPVRDIQVLSPMHKGVLGVENLNVMLQRSLNPSGASFTRRSMEFRVADKVMQTRNNYELEVFNGDTGILVDVDRRGPSFTVAFDGRLVAYSQAEAEDLVVAYATTIHKAQGSEYPAVVLPVHTQHALMLARNLLYTAVSRGKRMVAVVGSERAVRMGVENNRSRTRFTLLAGRIERESRR
jgi:exodeoxyribonuclease V alpha subunit